MKDTKEELTLEEVLEIIESVFYDDDECQPLCFDDNETKG